MQKFRFYTQKQIGNKRQRVRHKQSGGHTNGGAGWGLVKENKITNKPENKIYISMLLPQGRSS